MRNTYVLLILALFWQTTSFARTPLNHAASTIDLHLSLGVDDASVSTNTTVTYTVKVWNEGGLNATRVQIADKLPAGLQYVSSTATRGSYAPTTGVWTVGNIAALGDTVRLTLKATVTGEGVIYNTAEVSTAGEPDADSTPGNGRDNEDDLDRVCISAPVQLLQGQSLVVTVPPQYTGIQWFKNNGASSVATGNTYTITSAGSYTYKGMIGRCASGSDCPIVVTVKSTVLKTGYYLVQNRASALYMDIFGASLENGANLISYKYRGSKNQIFYVQVQPSGSYVIQPTHSNKALSTNNTNDNNPIYQWTTDVNKPNHNWRIAATSDGFFTIQSVFSNKFMQAGPNPSASGAGSFVVQNTYAANNQYQQWRFQSITNPNAREGVVDTSSSLLDDFTEIQDLLLLPNPAQNQVTVAYTLADGEQAEVKVLNLTGIELMSQPAQATQTVLDISHLGTGLYFINLQSNTGKRLVQKLIINK